MTDGTQIIGFRTTPNYPKPTIKLSKRVQARILKDAREKYLHDMPIDWSQLDGGRVELVSDHTACVWWQNKAGEDVLCLTEIWWRDKTGEILQAGTNYGALNF